METILPVGEYRAEQLLMDSSVLLGGLQRAGQLLDWEGQSILPEGPEEALIDYMARHRTAAGPLVLALLHTLRRVYGAGVARVRRQVERYTQAVTVFLDHYGQGPLALGRAPARINVLGEHVDYVRYLPTEVLPFASREHDNLIVFRPGDEPRVRGRSTLAGTGPAEFALKEGPRPRRYRTGKLDQRWLAWLRETGAPEKHWINYVKASVFFCMMKHPGMRRGFDFLLDSTVPAAGGASSSSTLVVLAGAAVRLANDLPFNAEMLAEDSARAEWYVGTRGGNMDHCAMCLSRRQHALHLNFTPFSTELVPLHRYRYRWVTLFAHEADKGGDVLLEYNERSAVSRVLIPALLEERLAADAELKKRWRDATRTLSRDKESVATAEEARDILALLPEAMTLAEVRRDYPQVFAEFERSYPQLARAPGDRSLMIRARAMHHVGEVVRVRRAVGILKELFSSRMPEEPEKTEPGLRAVGEVITEAHESMRDNYGLTTPHIDELMDIILNHPGVYGARLMGGGFGGNILVLCSKEHVAELVDRAQKEYYGPRRRDAVAEGSIMVSTPGEGFGVLCPRDVLRQSIINASAMWWKWDRYEAVMERSASDLLGIDDLAEFTPVRPIQPIVVAGGRGRLSNDRGYRSPSSLNLLNGRTSLAHVLDAIGAMPFKTLPPIVVVSPAMAGRPLARTKMPPGARLVIQRTPRGTGHAVLRALGEITDEQADALVVWGSQPLLSARTLARSIIAHQALGSAAMVFPTAVTRRPYAPIQRDLHGYVVASLETATEGAPTKRLGETNVGAFVLGATTLIETLKRLHREKWIVRKRRYNTPSGDLGFPNQMARALVDEGRAVIALPIAAVEESLGLRNREGYERVRKIMRGRTSCRGE